MSYRILVLVIIMASLSCKKEVVERVISEYPNEKPKEIHYFEKQRGKEIKVAEKYFFENGQLKMEGKFAKGMRDGEWKAYFNNGQLQSVGNYKDDKRVGGAKVYYGNGQLMYEGHYRDDKEVGYWKFYDEKGNVTQEKNF